MSVPDSLASSLADRYTIERELGAGGMATVYLAHDIRHDRRVALKVLRPELAAVIGAERFLSEIRTTANLQHPHILPLFDSGQGVVPPLRDTERGTGGEVFLFYVMPYVEGESLRDRLDREKQLPVPDAVRIATEVAAALDYAHRHGVIHRDIKPENILLHDGSALVADFGIALAVSTAGGGTRMTETGMSLGTPHYMSPEQAMGEREITPRSDVYALGAMTYEMLSGDPPFTGSTAQAIVAKVMSEEPAPLRRYRKAVPEAVEAAVLTALEKLPADRFATAAEFAAALTDPSGTVVRRRSVAEVRRPRPVLYAGLVIAALVLLGAAYVAGRNPGEDGRAVPSRLAMLATDLGGTGVAAQYRQVALTPDGQSVVFVTVDRLNRNALAIQRLDDIEPTLIEGSMGILSPRVTPDGKFIVGWGAGAWSGEQEHGLRLPIGGGTAERVAGDPQTNNMDWGPDGAFWFTPTLSSGIERLLPDGTRSAAPGPEASRLRMQQVLPDGRRALATRGRFGVASGSIVLLDLETGAVTPLSDLPVVDARITQGELLYVRPDGTMWAAPFDADAGQISGRAVQIAGDVDVGAVSMAQWAVAPGGTVAYVPATPQSLMLVNRDGSRRAAAPDRTNYHFPQFSPDGNRLTIDLTTADGRDVWLLSLDQRTLTRVTFTGDGHDATWTPDGTAITFTSFSGTNAGIWKTRPGTGAAAESLFTSSKLSFTGVWLPDGSGLVTVATDLAPGSGLDLGRVEGEGKGPLVPLLANAFDVQYPAISPDGRWLAYVSDQSGAQQVYVRPLDGSDTEVQVSREGGTEPAWRDNGRELFYIAPAEGGKAMMAAAVRTDPAFEVQSRQILFDASEYPGANPHRNYDVTPDGQTFAMVQRNPANRIVVLQNVGELVKRIRGE